MAGGVTPKVSHKGRRLKGAAFERELVALFTEYGLDAKRVPLSGATTFQKGDITVKATCFPADAPALVGEAKRRASLPTIFSAIGSHDFLAVRADRGEPYVVITARRFAELLQ